MRHYHHLILSEREKLLFFLAKGYTLTYIAKKMGRNKSTISRELHRNASGKHYLPVDAEAKARQRHSHCRPHKRLDNPVLLKKVKSLISVHQWSPEEISHRLTLEGSPLQVSFVTIYRAIHSGMLDAPLTDRYGKGFIKKLRHHGKKRHLKGVEERRGKFPVSHDISERTAGAVHRSRRSHFEADTVAGKKGKACLVTLVDRKSRYLLGGKADQKKADAVNTVIIELLRGQPLHSITPDRGKEFSKHAKVTEALDGVKFYFPKPHQPWQRGTNENTNGLLREYFPKGKDITDISNNYIQEKIDELNLRPRKCLGYKTPYEVYFSKTLHLT